MNPLQAYVDTSVFGGCFDDEFQAPSRTFFDQVREGRFRLLTSAVVQAELEGAPNQVREFFEATLGWATVLEVSDEALALQDAYLEAGIIPTRWARDALHVALASVSRSDFIASWNFKHIVHLEKIPRYNAVNTLEGYPAIAIYSPREVLAYEEEDV